jgi:hypothetical protein
MVKSKAVNPKETKKTRQLRVKRDTVNALQSATMLTSNNLEKHTKQFFALIIGATALISGLITFGITNQLSPQLSDRTTLAAQTSGGVCLSEDELRTLITNNQIVAYWTGPIKDATYSINTTTPGQVFVRYIPKGMECGDTEPKYRVIATYNEVNAFDSTQQAGNQAEGVSLANTDGSIVYFSKNAPNNVYLAYPGIDYQIEIYDPDAKTAVTLATTNNQVQLIKG